MKAHVAHLILCILSWLICPAAACEGPRTAGEIRSFLLEGTDYDRYTRPAEAVMAAVAALIHSTSNSSSVVIPEEPAPEMARIQWHILSLDLVDQKTNEFGVTVWFRRSWQDDRLRFKTQSEGGCFPDDKIRAGFHEDILNEIWKPDFYVENLAVPTQQIDGAVWLYPSG